MMKREVLESSCTLTSIPGTGRQRLVMPRHISTFPDATRFTGNRVLSQSIDNYFGSLYDEQSMQVKAYANVDFRVDAGHAK